MSIKQGKKYLSDKLITIETFNTIKDCCGVHTKYVGWLCKQYINEPLDIGSMKSYVKRNKLMETLQ
jgi:hypothetical protein